MMPTAEHDTPRFDRLLAEVGAYDYDEYFGRRWPVDVLSTHGLDTISDAIARAEGEFLRRDGDRLVITKAELLGSYARLVRPGADPESHALYAVLVLLWGYASQGYGEFRTGNILRRNGVRRVGTTTRRAARSLAAGNLEAAYTEFFENGCTTLKYVGESFFTKLLFFLSRCQGDGGPTAYIKDIHTSRGAALFGADPSVMKKRWDAYARYVRIVDRLAAEFGVSGERIEEVLFQASRDKLIASDWVERPDAVNEVLRGDANDVEAWPTLVLNRAEPGLLPDGDGPVRVVLFADGQPNGDLAPMTFGAHSKPESLIADGFYSAQRRAVFNRGVDATAQLESVVLAVATTGHGIVALDRHVTRYNVPGQDAVKKEAYVEAYVDAVSAWLGKLREECGDRDIALVYYAGGSRRAFRTMVWRGIGEWAKADRASGRRFRVLMYGARRHSAGWDDLLPTAFAWLDGETPFESAPREMRDWADKARHLNSFVEAL